MRGKSFSSLFYLEWRVRTKQGSTEFRAEAGAEFSWGESCRGNLNTQHPAGERKGNSGGSSGSAGSHLALTVLWQICINTQASPPPSPTADLLQLHVLSQLQLSWASRACPDMSAQHRRSTSSCRAGNTESKHPQCVNQSDHKGLIYLKPFLCFQAVWVCQLNSQSLSVRTLIT